MMLWTEHRARWMGTLAMVLVLLSGTMNQAMGQGCSDGGLCTIAELEPTRDLHQEAATVRLNAGVSYGAGHDGLQVYTPSVGLSLRLVNKVGINLKLTAAKVDGDLGKTNGLGDAFLTAAWHPGGLQAGLSLFIGLKQPLGSSNASVSSNPLPMEYQATLGTTDLLAGMSWSIDRYELSIGWQNSLSDHNDNEFISGPLPKPSAKDFPTTYHFDRSGDLLIRLSANLPFLEDRLAITPSLLPIYHYANDRYQVPNGEFKNLDGSKGWTVNLNVYGNFALSDKTSVGASFGAPMVARSSRPDGLTRQFVLGLHLSHKLR
ncbi:hypothetical protein KQI63_00880 [bacterium]|nr:hypothetical protein [bacterium]